MIPYHCVFLLLYSVTWGSDDSHRHLTAPCSTCALGQARPTMLCIHLVMSSRGMDLRSRLLLVWTWEWRYYWYVLEDEETIGMDLRLLLVRMDLKWSRLLTISMVLRMRQFVWMRQSVENGAVRLWLRIRLLLACWGWLTYSTRTIRTVNGHILRVGTVVHSNSSIWAGGEACLRSSTVDVIQPDKPGARSKPGKESSKDWALSWTLIAHTDWYTTYTSLKWHQSPIYSNHSPFCCISFWYA